MKITIVQGAFLPIPPIRGGGIEKVWHGLGVQFACQGHQVTHISRLCNDLPQQETVAGVRHLRFPGYDQPASLSRLKLMDLAYSLRVCRALPPADILVTNTFCLPMLVRSRRPGRIYVHVARYPRGQMRFYRHAARLQPCSQVIARAICEQTPQIASLVKVVPNPLPDAAFHPDEESLLTSERDETILFVGRVHPEKGIELLLEALRALHARGFTRWRAAIVGPWETRQGGGGEDYYRRLRDRYREMDASVDWVGPIFDPEKLYAHYRRAALFVCPTLAAKGEAAPATPVEAMAAGCPPVMSDLECFRDYLQEGRNGFVFNHEAPEPALALAEKLQMLIEDTSLRAAVARYGLETAHRYRMPQIAQLFLEDFQSLL